MVDNPIEWIKRNFFSKRNFTDVSNGAVDAFRPVVLNISGYLDRTLFGSELDVDGPIVAVFNSRYRIGISPFRALLQFFPTIAPPRPIFRSSWTEAQSVCDQARMMQKLSRLTLRAIFKRRRAWSGRGRGLPTPTQAGPPG